MIKAAHPTARTHPHWKAELRCLEPRLGRKKAIVAIARKLLVAVWHVLAEEAADRYAVDLKVAHAFFAFAYRVGVHNLPDGLSAKTFVRQQAAARPTGIGEGADRLPVGWQDGPAATITVTCIAYAKQAIICAHADQRREAKRF